MSIFLFPIWSYSIYIYTGLGNTEPRIKYLLILVPVRHFFQHFSVKQRGLIIWKSSLTLCAMPWSRMNGRINCQEQKKQVIRSMSLKKVGSNGPYGVSWRSLTGTLKSVVVKLLPWHTKSWLWCISFFFFFLPYCLKYTLCTGMILGKKKNRTTRKKFNFVKKSCRNNRRGGGAWPNQASRS